MKGHHLPTDLPTDLDAILRSIWEAFEVGVREAGHPFHTPVVATAGPADCDARVVVLRRASPDRRELAFHTDARAPKVRLLQACHTTAWVFYDPAGKIQVRAKGNTVVHQGDAVAADAWARTRLMSRRCYLAEVAPSTPSDTPSSGLPPALVERSPTAEESEAGFVNFAVCVTEVIRLDWLQLAARGHRRAAFTWDDHAAGWRGHWLTP
ncbi:flavin-binding protein [Chloracidobacterium sp. D]|jgi:3-hydroxyisobutyrate dehydrogenase|uniref:flavin-binding protein n=1 Tax=Chloracidobacterium sp. D TaxID=2821536 RepID=UPI001B8B3FAB|nr:flavin-binding protein [Chloracidobacterium sp. D]QUV81959.1 flavin-binding protein [Chloracidobacterium sp. D]